ncbi:hypothetical protein GGF37_007337, partial [Kickxella alabastrina]
MISSTDASIQPNNSDDHRQDRYVDHWLPEINSPSLSITMLSLAQDKKDNSEAVNSANSAYELVAKEWKPTIPAFAPTPASILAVIGEKDEEQMDFSYLDTIKSTGYADPNGPDTNLSLSILPATQHPPQQHGEVTTKEMLDHLGFDFDFATDPEIGDINNASLFSIYDKIVNLTSDCLLPAPTSPEAPTQMQQQHQQRQRQQWQKEVEDYQQVGVGKSASLGMRVRQRRSSITSLLTKRPIRSNNVGDAILANPTVTVSKGEQVIQVDNEVPAAEPAMSATPAAHAVSSASAVSALSVAEAQADAKLDEGKSEEHTAASASSSA